MKKLLTIILILAMAMPVTSLADLPDISNLTYDELVELKNKINLAMWNSEEWQEVTVPVGMWIIGEDIPAGIWHISVSPEAKKKWGSFKYCDLLDESGIKPGNMFSCDIYVSQTLNRADADDGSDPTSIEIELKRGCYFFVDNAPLVFTPPQGKPDLGFK